MGGTAGAKVEVLVQRALTNGLPARQSSGASGERPVKARPSVTGHRRRAAQRGTTLSRRERMAMVCGRAYAPASDVLVHDCCKAIPLTY